MMLKTSERPVKKVNCGESCFGVVDKSVIT